MSSKGISTLKSNSNGMLDEWEVKKDIGPFTLQYMINDQLNTIEYSEKESKNIKTGEFKKEIKYKGINPIWNEIKAYENEGDDYYHYFVEKNSNDDCESENHPIIYAHNSLNWIKIKRNKDYSGRIEWNEINENENENSKNTISLKWKPIILKCTCSSSFNNEIHEKIQYSKLLISHKSIEEEKYTHGLFTYKDLEILSKIENSNSINSNINRNQSFWEKALNSAGISLLTSEADYSSSMYRQNTQPQYQSDGSSLVGIKEE
ncbi:uncharacterized protein I206_101304 [Kwoniella pini CBS 10737]|uniref:Uncharacterized protein n=1 Tax=Kwoniella pini CBS 10737 TaxID=1296096 RepID=A0A1B9IB87_9TREE|nr:uncharacterized protein I206_00020 [Kwoniella pini CBS 10737]OCF52724.1 hypothetical protein I206_00020 [Kwoniella pini CBS 10737]